MKKKISLLAGALAFAGAAVVPTGIVTAAPASAAGCFNTRCDFQGPQGAGCFPDHQVLAAANDGAGTRVVTLRFSPGCHAFYAYGANAPASGDAELSLEMETKNSRGVWTNVGRTFGTLSAGENADWTSALGARGQAYRFRALYKKPNGAVFVTDYRSVNAP